jgi:hypothetical protein
MSSERCSFVRLESIFSQRRRLFDESDRGEREIDTSLARIRTERDAHIMDD